MFCGTKSCNMYSNAVFRHRQPHNRFATCFFISLSMIHLSKSAQQSAVQVCQVATVVKETTQLVLRQFKNVFITVNGELNKVSLCQKYLVNVVNWSYVILTVAVRFFWDTLYLKWNHRWNCKSWIVHLWKMLYLILNIKLNAAKLKGGFKCHKLSQLCNTLAWNCLLEYILVKN